MRLAVVLALLVLFSLDSFALGQSASPQPPRLIRKNHSSSPPSSGPIRKRISADRALDLNTIQQVEFTETAPAPDESPMSAPVLMSDYLEGAEIQQPQQMPRPMDAAVVQKVQAKENTEAASKAKPIPIHPMPAQDDQWHPPLLRVEPKWVETQKSKQAEQELKYETPREEDEWTPTEKSESVTAKKPTSPAPRKVVDLNQIEAPPPPLEEADADQSSEYNPPPIDASDISPMPIHDPHSHGAWEPVDSMTEACLPYYSDSYYEPVPPCETCYQPQVCEECWVEESPWVEECELEQTCEELTALNTEIAPVLTFGAKGGSDRSLGEIQAMLPLWQGEQDFLYGDIQGRFSDNEESEGHFGLGLRMLLDEEWILGTYAYYDLRKTLARNRFNQLTLGLELMSIDWDFRVNGYFPNEGYKNSSINSGVSNGTIVTNSFQERAYRGMSLEVGRRILRWGRFDTSEVRLFFGYYYFDTGATGFPQLDGPRTRVEYRNYELPFFGPQSRFTAGLEYSNDNVRDDQFWGYLRITVPLSPKWSRQPLGIVQRRMMDPTYRSID